MKLILEMAFSANCTQIWKLNRISMTIMTAPAVGGNCAVELKSVVKIAMSACFPYVKEPGHEQPWYWPSSLQMT